MQNDVHIELLPLPFTHKDFRRPEGKLKARIAEMNLQGAKNTLSTLLKNDIPVYFKNSIHLKLSIARSSLAVKINYSAIPTRKQKNLIKDYIEGNMEDFAGNWLALAR